MSLNTPSVGATTAPASRPAVRSGRLAIYRELSKSGIVTLVVISVTAGYFIGHPFETPIDWGRFLTTFFGIYFLASGSSVLNQIQEHRIDASMPRTAGRPLPSGRLSLAEAWTICLLTLLGGAGLLWTLGTAVFLLGLAAVATYNGFYTLWWKRRWAYAAVPGAIPGALPVVMGYVAANGSITAPAGWYLFAVLFFWQMPHFWALALRYSRDYQAGGFPTLPVALGAEVTVYQIVLWCLGYVAVAIIAPLFLNVGATYLVIALLTSAKVFWELAKFVRAPESRSWLHFFLWVNFSLIFYFAAMGIDRWSVYLLIPLTR